MLVRRDAMVPYPAVPVREDTQVAQTVRSRRGAVSSDDHGLYCYIVHANNTSDTAHFESLFDDASWVFPDYDAELVKRSADFPMRWYADEVIAKQSGQEVVDNRGATLIVHAEKRFGQEVVRVDGVCFRRCSFDNTTFVYLGGKPPLFEDCTFTGVSFELFGSANNTLNYLRHLKQIRLINGI